MHSAGDSNGPLSTDRPADRRQITGVVDLNSTVNQLNLSDSTESFIFWPKDLNGHLTKEDVQMANKHRKIRRH